MRLLREDIHAAIDGEQSILVGSVQRGEALKWALAREARASGRRVWRTPKVLTFSTWAEHALLQDSLRYPARLHPRLLTQREEWAIYRAVAKDLAHDYDFVTTRRLAAELSSAAMLIDEWRLPTHRGAAERLSPEHELLFMAQKLAAERLTALNAAPARRQWARLEAVAAPLNLIEPHRLSPARRAVLERLGVSLDRSGAQPHATPKAQTLASPTAECVAAAEWCRDRLAENPQARLLLVAPDLATRREPLERALSQALEPARWLGVDNAGRAFSVEGGRPLSEFVRIRHSLDTLRLFTQTLSFDEVSHWLREPYFEAPSADDRARIDLALRAAGRLEFSPGSLAAWLGSAPPAVAPAAKLFAARLRAAADMLGTGSKSAGAWAEIFGRIVAAVTGRSETQRSSEQQQVFDRWLELLTDMGALATVVGPLDARAAVDLLFDLAVDIRYDVASADVPVLVTSGELGPITDYDGIWAMGLDADVLPAAPSAHALVPLSWQIRAGIPMVTAEGRAAEAQTMLAGWRAHAGELILSAPRERDGAVCAPSALLAEFAPLAARSRGFSPLLVALRDQAPIESIVDECGAPWPGGVPVKAGVRSFDLQSRCAFRAYGELRLGAVPVETPTPGIHPLDRGDWLHRALYEFWGELKSSATAQSLTTEQLQAAASAAVEAAYRAVNDRLRGSTTSRTVRRESARLARLILTAVQSELQRSSFVVNERECRRQLALGGGHYDLRIDRVDQLDDDSIAIIDYKSGAARSIDWQGPRPSEPQLLVYWLTEPDRERVAALWLLHLSRDRATWRGEARVKLFNKPATPGSNTSKQNDTPHLLREWQDMSSAWPTTLERLARDYLTGMATVDPREPTECQYCHLTTLCRRTELSIARDTDGEDESADTEAATDD